MDGQNRILVIQSMGLGDLLFSLPALRVLKRQFPNDRITFVTHTQNQDLLSLVPEVEEVVVYHNKTPTELFRLVRAVRHRPYRMALVLNPIFRGSVLAWCSGASIRVGYLRDYEGKQSLWGLGKILLTQGALPRDEKMHEVERYLDLVRQMGLNTQEEDRTPRLILTKEAREFGHCAVDNLQNSRKGPLVAIHPGAGWNLRQWPQERFAEVADWLVAHYDARIIYTGGHGENSLVEEIRRRMHRESASYAGRTNLAQLAGLLSQCNLFLANDTGSLHIAAALDVPTIALFGPGDPKKVRPLSSGAVILYHPVPWAPCQVQYTNKCQNNLCMKEISVDEVKDAASRLLGRPPEETFSALNEPPKQSVGPLKKILYLQSTSEISGTDTALLRVLELLDQTHFEPHVVLHREGPFGQAYRNAGSRVHILPSMRKLTSRKGFGYLIRYFLGYPGAVLQITRLIQRERIDIVHTNTIHNLYGFLAAKCAGVPHVWHIREIVIQAPLLGRIEKQLVTWFSTRFIVMNNVIAQGFTRRGGGLPRHIAKLYDGVDLSEFHPNVSGKRIRTELGIGEKTPLVGVVSRLDPWKGLEIFLEAAAQIHRRIPEARFLICGGEIEGHERYPTLLQKKAGALGLDGIVFFTGWRYRHRDIPEVYRALDVSVQCPVYPEPYGLANVEAMACGVPVVAVAQGGPTELCVNGETALLVPPLDPPAVAQAVISLLKDPDRAKAMGLAGRHRAEKLFDRRRCVKELEALYEEIIPHHRQL